MIKGNSLDRYAPHRTAPRRIENRVNRAMDTRHSTRGFWEGRGVAWRPNKHAAAALLTSLPHPTQTLPTSFIFTVALDAQNE